MNRKIIRKASIEHLCLECYEAMHKDEKYLEISGDNGYFHWTLRFCKKCKGIK